VGEQGNFRKGGNFPGGGSTREGIGNRAKTVSTTKGKKLGEPPGTKKKISRKPFGEKNGRYALAQLLAKQKNIGPYALLGTKKNAVGFSKKNRGTLAWTLNQNTWRGKKKNIFRTGKGKKKERGEMKEKARD